MGRISVKIKLKLTTFCMHLTLLIIIIINLFSPVFGVFVLQFSQRLRCLSFYSTTYRRWITVKQRSLSALAVDYPKNLLSINATGLMSNGFT